MTRKQFRCTMCGNCCHLTVGITLLDVDRMAEYLGIHPRDALDRYTTYPGAGAFLLLAKDAGGRCYFLGDDNLCAIHLAKPWSGRVYICSKEEAYIDVPDDAPFHDDAPGEAEVRELAVARQETERYVERHGNAYHEEDYRATIGRIRARLDPRSVERVKAAKLEHGALHVIAFDCAGCHHRPVCCRRGPVTLEDVRRLSEHLGLSVEEFFARYIDSAPSDIVPGALAVKAKDGDRCAFLEPGALTCAVEYARPARCRFMPCPLLVGEGEMAQMFFVNSGTVEEQYRNQAALAVTRRYIEKHGTRYREAAVREAMAQLDRLFVSAADYEAFRNAIASCRFGPGSIPGMDDSTP